MLQDPCPDPQQPPQSLPPSSGAVLPQHTACSDDDIVSIPRKKRPLEPHDGKTPGTATAGKEEMLRRRQKKWSLREAVEGWGLFDVFSITPVGDALGAQHWSLTSSQGVY